MFDAGFGSEVRALLRPLRSKAQPAACVLVAATLSKVSRSQPALCHSSPSSSAGSQLSLVLCSHVPSMVRYLRSSSHNSQHASCPCVRGQRAQQ